MRLLGNQMEKRDWGHGWRVKEEKMTKYHLLI
jgi:hypothetical protein